jgi:hypothetical protein
MHQRFSDLDNLIWVYGAANQDYCVDVDALWPGNDVVDIAGFSMYQATVTGDPFPKLARHNKIVAFTEFGLFPRDGTTDLMERLALLKRYPQVKYALHWHSWNTTTGLASIVDQLHTAEYMNDAYAITRDELPWSPTATPAPRHNMDCQCTCTNTSSCTCECYYDEKK